MNNVSITIFTPTYNRGYTLSKCYESLKRQKYKNFEWIIYDDGSTDDTREIVQQFINEDKIDIRYFYSKNYGKHIAINKGTDLAYGELFFIVDSDDYLTDSALELVIDAWNSIEENERYKFVGVAGRRNLINKNNFKFKFNTKYYDCNSIKFNLIDGNIQDKAEVYVTEILKRYKFPKYNNESFMTEAVVWYQLAQDGYKIRWFNEDIYICEYLSDGLTANFFKKRIESINSTCFSYNKLSSFDLPKNYKIRYKINYFRYGLNKYKLTTLIKNMYNKKFCSIAIIGGYIAYFRDRKINK